MMLVLKIKTGISTRNNYPIKLLVIHEKGRKGNFHQRGIQTAAEAGGRILDRYIWHKCDVSIRWLDLLFVSETLGFGFLRGIISQPTTSKKLD